MTEFQVGLKWKMLGLESQYFVKETENNWVEYQNGRKLSKFTEIFSQYPNVILKNEINDVFVKLTEIAGYWSHDQNNITTHFCHGNWENNSTFFVDNELDSVAILYSSNIDSNNEFTLTPTVLVKDNLNENKTIILDENKQPSFPSENSTLSSKSASLNDFAFKLFENSSSGEGIIFQYIL